MTEGLVPLLDSLAYPPAFVKYTFFTSPTTRAESVTAESKPAQARAIPSVNSPADAEESAAFCLPHLEPLLADHDAFLVACYSQHPLVPQLQQLVAAQPGPRKYVTGIFEASVVASLALLQPVAPADGTSSGETFGIVSTGSIWEQALQNAVHEFLGIGGDSGPGPRRFVGVETTGLNATDLHDLPADRVREEMIKATKRLLKKDWRDVDGVPSSSVKAICLGCAGMAGLDDAVRQACVEALGEKLGSQIHIVDGVKAGVSTLVGLAMARF